MILYIFLININIYIFNVEFKIYGYIFGSVVVFFLCLLLYSLFYYLDECL